VKLENRIAIVTGAASGIGNAIAKRFLAEGARVLAVDRNTFDMAGAQIFRADLSDTAAATSIAQKCVADLGGIDILVNNAGISGFMELENHTDDFWHDTLDIDLSSVFRMCRASLPTLKSSRFGRVINMGSVMSTFGNTGLAAYAAAKHGVLGLTRALASELGPHGITVNCIQPGAILTGMTEPTFETMPDFKLFWENKAALKRLGTPQDIANVAAFLASDDASFVSGHGIFVDGGAMQQP
jgi:3-oxoacyl-[acyl-carrier protein] reductase